MTELKQSENHSSPLSSPFGTLSPLLGYPASGSGSSLQDPILPDPLDDSIHGYAPRNITTLRAAEIRAGQPLDTNDMDIFSARMHDMFPKVAGLKAIVTASSSSRSSSSSSSSKYTTFGDSPRLVQIIFGSVSGEAWSRWYCVCVCVCVCVCRRGGRPLCPGHCQSC
jgi:hypothetical protein